MVTNNRKYFSLALTLVVSAATQWSSYALAADSTKCESRIDAYSMQQRLLNRGARTEVLGDKTPLVVKSYESDAPIVHSYEKEGLFYEEIALWFDRLRPEGLAKIKDAFKNEKQNPAKRPPVHTWVNKITPLPFANNQGRSQWKKMTTDQRFEWLLSQKDMFAVLTIADRSYLFEYDILTFNEVTVGDNAPPYVTVGDDDGSYEDRLLEGIVDRTQFLLSRQTTETLLEGPVGHQHLFHGWPDDPAVRAKYAPGYLGLLTDATWYLFWRQIRRDPRETDSILTHPYLGVYTQDTLKRLHRAMVRNDAESLKKNVNSYKFRMIGARSFRASPNIPEQGLGWIPDWELRSGNKAATRDEFEANIEARLATGDVSGIKPYDVDPVDPNQDLKQLIRFATNGTATAADLKQLEQFEATFPFMNFSRHKLAQNSRRSRIISPLLQWEQRLPMTLMLELLNNQRAIYARELIRIARTHNSRLNTLTKKYQQKSLSLGEFNYQKGELRAEIIEQLEMAIYRFANKVRLDLVYATYLYPNPQNLPDVRVASTGPIDVNTIGMGIENSFRFPVNIKPRKKADAERMIKQLAIDFAKKVNGKLVEEQVAAGAGGHGHSIVVKYYVIDSQNQKWRIEWDGIQRYYVDGKPRRAWGGHVEVPSPKYAPQSAENDIAPLYRTARALGLMPKRLAGGGHVNQDLGVLEALPQDQYINAVINSISEFETEQMMMMFLWMHPRRTHAATPVLLHPDLPKALFNFKGNKLELAQLLYELRYFNTSIGRKPKYMPYNVTALIVPAAPPEYVDSHLDIRNPDQKWFPHFGKMAGRLEARFFDAPKDEVMAALQLKYWRAFMNYTLNNPNRIAMAPAYTAEDVERWKSDPKAFVEAAVSHLLKYGLDPKEFESLIWEAYKMRSTIPTKPPVYKPYDGFLPSPVSGQSSSLERELAKSA